MTSIDYITVHTGEHRGLELPLLEIVERVIMRIDKIGNRIRHEQIGSVIRGSQEITYSQWRDWLTGPTSTVFGVIVAKNLKHLQPGKNECSVIRSKAERKFGFIRSILRMKVGKSALWYSTCVLMINGEIDWPLSDLSAIYSTYMYVHMYVVQYSYECSPAPTVIYMTLREPSLRKDTEHPRLPYVNNCSKYRRLIYNVKLTVYRCYAGWGEERKGKKVGGSVW